MKEHGNLLLHSKTPKWGAVGVTPALTGVQLSTASPRELGKMFHYLKYALALEQIHSRTER